MTGLRLTLLWLCWTAPLCAAENAERKLAPLQMQSLLETSGGLLLILALILGGAWLFKRYGRMPLAGKGLISIESGISVGPRERVVVVKIENTRLVLGVAPGRVVQLHVMDAAEPSPFAQQLQAAIQQPETGTQP